MGSVSPLGNSSSPGTGTKYGATGRLRNSIVAVGGLAEVQVVAPVDVVALGGVAAVVVEPPPRLGAGERRAGGHLGAVADERHLDGAHQFVRCAGADAGDLVAHPLEGLHGDRQLGGGLGRGDVVVDEAAQLVLDLRLRRAVGMPQRPVDQFVRRRDLVGRKSLAALRRRPAWTPRGVPARSP